MKTFMTITLMALTSFSAMAGLKDCVIRTFNPVAQQYLTSHGFRVVNSYLSGAHFDLDIAASYSVPYEECENGECMTFASQSSTIYLTDYSGLRRFESEAGEYDYPIFKLGPPSGPNLKRISLKLLEELNDYMKANHFSCN